MASLAQQYLKRMKASDIPRSTELLLDCSQLDVVKDDTMIVLTTHGEVIDFVNILQRNLAEHGAVARRHQRMRHKMLANKLKTADTWVCIGMLNGIPKDAEKWAELSMDCVEYACLEHVLYKKLIPVMLKEEMPAQVQEKMAVWTDHMDAMSGKAGQKEC
jgi:hypothetical protein